MSEEILPVPVEQKPIAQIIGEMAMDPACEPEKFKALLEVQKDYEANEARKKFAASMAAFQAQAPIIEKTDKAHNKNYARMDRIWRSIKPLLAECGLSIMWRKVEVKDDMCHIEGTLSQALGHTVELSHDIPLPDSIKGQNKAQQAASGTTYAKRYALCAALGIVCGDDNDGNGGGEIITPKQAALLRELIKEKSSDPEGYTKQILTWAQCGSVDVFPASKYQTAMDNLEAM